jgi:hypothetical protein
VAVVLINFQNDLSEPQTVADARATWFDPARGVAALWREQSYGKHELVGDVFGYWTVPYDNAPCDTLAWKNAARARALAQGVDLDADYDHVALKWPHTAACPYSGRAGSFFNGAMTEYSAGHEFGHSFSLNHSSKWNCYDPAGSLVVWSASCVSAEYADSFSIMGHLKGHFTGWQKAKVGWLTNTLTVTVSGRYTLAPQEWVGQTVPQLLLVRRLDGTVLTLEKRANVGTEFDIWPRSPVGDYARLGVLARVATQMPLEPAKFPNREFVLDAHPGPTDQSYDAAFTPGETITDPLGGLSVTVVAADPEGNAVVDVEVNQ